MKKKWRVTVNDKTFDIGEMCLIPMIGKSGMTFSYGIIIKRNCLKLRSNYYSVYVNGNIEEYENLFITKLEELDESYNTY